MTEKITKRQIESAKKKKIILDNAKTLFKQYGYESTTLADISKASGFSTGSIVNFFHSKEGLLLEISSEMSSISFDLSNLDVKAHDPYKYLMDFLIRYAVSWETLGLDLTKQVYKSFSKAFLNKDEKTFKHMPAYSSMETFIMAAQQAGTFDTSISAVEASAYIITVCRGLVYEWCLFDGSYSLSEKSKGFLPRLLNTYMNT